MKRLVFLLIGILVANVYFQAAAAAEVILDRGKVKLTIKAGETITGFITLRNDSNTDIPLRAYFGDFVYIPPFDGSKKFLPLGATESSCGEWVSFSPQEFTLPALTKRQINYVIKVPQDASGGYYGVLFFETAPGKPEEGKGLQIITRIGSLFFLETEDRIKRASLNDLSIEEDSIQAHFVNSGNVILISNAVFYIMDEEGMVVDRREIKKFYLPPGEKFPFTIPILAGLSSGSYTVVLTFDLEEGDILVREIDFSKDEEGEIKILQIRE